jgi:hypothetical protein
MSGRECSEMFSGWGNPGGKDGEGITMRSCHYSELSQFQIEMFISKNRRLLSVCSGYLRVVPNPGT